MVSLGLGGLQIYIGTVKDAFREQICFGQNCHDFNLSSWDSAQATRKYKTGNLFSIRTAKYQCCGVLIRHLYCLINKIIDDDDFAACVEEQLHQPKRLLQEGHVQI